MSFNTVITALPTGYNEFDVAVEAGEPPVEETAPGKTFIWTIHPKRRMHAYRDVKRKRQPFLAQSVNDDFRAWRRIVTYVGEKVKAAILACKNYSEWKATKMSYGQIKATGKTYGELNYCPGDTEIT